MTEGPDLIDQVIEKVQRDGVGDACESYVSASGPKVVVAVARGAMADALMDKLDALAMGDL